mgnify:CR=1 FL=1
MYKFAKQRDVKELAKWCEGIIKEVQKEVKDCLTFSFDLIGSGGKRLVTQNGEEAFDLDYNLIIQKDKQGLIDDPKSLKNIIRNAFDSVLRDNVQGYSGAKEKGSSLRDNILNLISFLPEDVGKKCAEDIDSCAEDKNAEQDTQWDLPEQAVVLLE